VVDMAILAVYDGERLVDALQGKVQNVAEITPTF